MTNAGDTDGMMAIELLEVAKRYSAICVKERHLGLLNLLEICSNRATCDRYDDSSDSSFAIVNLSQILDHVILWKNTFPNVKVAYPVKVNPDPDILELLQLFGCDFDIASANEMDLVIKAGGNPVNMIYSHTAKNISHMKKASALGVKLSIVDSIDEMEKHAKFWPKAQLLIRLATEKDSSCGPQRKKFGAFMESVPELFEEAKRLGLSICGVHFHVGSLTLSAGPYIAALRDAREVTKMGRDAGFDMSIINIGGGFHCPSESALPNSKGNFLVVAEEIKESMSSLFGGPEGYSNIKFMAEPGTFMAIQSMSVACRVTTVRKNSNIWVDESSYGTLKALSWKRFKDIVGRSISILNLCTSSPKFFRLHRGGSTLINGNTCDWEDVIEIPVDLQVGSVSPSDIILFENMGAYSLACACDFNGFNLASMPIEYVFNSLSSMKNKDGFHVQYKIANIPKKGFGLVLCQPVKEGEVVWAFKNEGETHISYNDMESLQRKIDSLATLPCSHEPIQFFLNHIFGWDGKIIELIGDCKFMNHSSNTVIRTTDGKTWVASRDLFPGDEIVDDYGTFDNPKWYVDACKEYDVEWAGQVAELYQN